MLFDDKDILASISGADQEDLIDEAAEDALNGDYTDDKADSEPLDVLMDAEEDEDELAEDYPELERAEEIIDHCCGTDENGDPNAAVAFIVTKYDIDTGKSTTVANAGLQTPVVQIHFREEFIEISLKFRTATAQELKHIYNAIEKYGDLVDARGMEIGFIPACSLVLVPIIDKGTALVEADNPFSWSLCADKPGEDCSTLRILFRAEDVNINGTDEIDMTQIEAEAEQAVEERAAENRAMTERERARQAHSAAIEDAFNNLTKK